MEQMSVFMMISNTVPIVGKLLEEDLMGDRHEWMDKCPNCGASMRCFYADSCGKNEVKCSDCKKKYDLILSFKLMEKSEEA